MSLTKKIDEDRFWGIVNEALQNPSDVLKSPNASLQDKRDAAMWSLLKRTRVWLETEWPGGPVQRSGATLSTSYGNELMSLLLNNSEPLFDGAKYLNNYMRALFGDKAYKD
jgi:hypothetical protein